MFYIVRCMRYIRCIRRLGSWLYSLLQIVIILTNLLLLFDFDINRNGSGRIRDFFEQYLRTVTTRPLFI